MGRLLWSSDQSAASVPHGRGDLAARPQLILLLGVTWCVTDRGEHVLVMMMMMAMVMAMMMAMTRRGR